MVLKFLPLHLNSKVVVEIVVYSNTTLAGQAPFLWAKTCAFARWYFSSNQLFWMPARWKLNLGRSDTILKFSPFIKTPKLSWGLRGIFLYFTRFKQVLTVRSKYSLCKVHVQVHLIVSPKYNKASPYGRLQWKCHAPHKGIIRFLHSMSFRRGSWGKLRIKSVVMTWSSHLNMPTEHGA